MAYKFFPNDKRDLNFVLKVYANEIQRRAQWTILAAQEVNYKLENDSSASEVIREASNVINNAMAIVRMIEESGNTKEGERTKERIQILKNKWDFPEPPSKLRSIRNKLEHLDEKFDEWVVKSRNRLIVDLHVGPPIGSFKNKEHFRRFEGDTFYFWEQPVNLSEVCKWVQDVEEEVSKEDINLSVN